MKSPKPHAFRGFKPSSTCADVYRLGQDESIHEIVRTYHTGLTGLSSEGRPIGNLLFLGPTGTGKRRAVEATAEALLGNPGAIIEIDCGEFQHSHEIAKLIGSPPGYSSMKQKPGSLGKPMELLRRESCTERTEPSPK
jgi:ATP-dependent Clp protease ATP-binding subunit ClpA